MQKVCVLGATGSVGRQSLDVVRAFADRFLVVALSACDDARQMAGLIEEFRPLKVAMADSGAADELKRTIGQDIAVEISAGAESVAKLGVSCSADIIVAAIVGRAGLLPVYRALSAGKKVALANKESLVMAGNLIMKQVECNNGVIIPVDSEHAALHHMINAFSADKIRKVIITASGGPFLGRSQADLSRVTAAQALAHPRWQMGKKISIDSATMMNKGFEVIEAHWLFGLPLDKIEVVVHPESLVHAIIETVDGTQVAHMSHPDMRRPAAYALHYPDLPDLPGYLCNYKQLDLADAGQLTFTKLDEESFPALALCRKAMERGGGIPAAITAADEVLVAAFLEEKILFTDIVGMLITIFDGLPDLPADSLDDVFYSCKQGEKMAKELVFQGKKT